MAVTASDLINQGDYLREGYDPTRLTIPLLTGILSHHNVHLQARDKASLVRAFRDHISPQKAKLSRERIARAETKASDEGITDGMTGKQVNRQRKSLARYEEEEETPSRRGPGKPRPSTQYNAPVKFDDDESEDDVVEDSEPEDEIPRSAKRRLSKGRRLSDITGREKLSNEDSDSEEVGNWSTDHNPFQQGGSSSPVKEDRRRSVGRKSLPSRKSLSREPPTPARSSKGNRRSIVPAPPSPQVDSSSPEPYQESPSRRQSQAYRQSAQWVASDTASRRTSIRNPEYDQLANQEDSEEEEYAEQDDDDEYAVYNSEVANRLANRQAIQKGPPFFTPGRTVVFALSLLFLGTFVGKYRLESSQLGFCDVNSNTNDIVKANNLAYELKANCSAQIAAARALTKHLEPAERGAAIDEEWDDCTPLPLISLPRPTKCTPCPKHASHCTVDSVTCEPDYPLSRHVLDRIPLASLTLNGMPGLGSVAFPPSCAVNKKRRVLVGKLARAIELYLATKRGEKLCAGTEDESSTAEAVTWGVPVVSLKETVRNGAPHMAESGGFDNNFNGAIEELKKAHQILEGVDSSGVKYYTSKRDQTSLSCSVRIRARHVWNAWRGTVIGLVVVALSALYARSQIARRSRDKVEVARLVQTSLDALRSQLIAYNADPTSVNAPYLPPAQLRDWVLQNEHSVSARKRLWKQVERVVESNANVRANVEEVEGGEETRVWKWVGAAQVPIQHGQGMPLPRPIA